MNRDEILKQAQKENKKADYPYGEAYKQSHTIAFSVGILIVSFLNLFETIFKNETNPAYLLIWMGCEFASYIYIYIKIRKKQDLIFTILYGLLTILFLVFYILKTYLGLL